MDKQVVIELGELTVRRDIRHDVTFVKVWELAALAEGDCRHMGQHTKQS
jgi:hypothetical protein